MKYSEAEKRIKALSSKYDISMRGGDFDVSYNGKTHIIYVSGDYKYGINVGYPEMFSVIPFSDNVYMILAELAMTPLDERVDGKKYRVKAFGMYLNIKTNNNHPCMNTCDNCYEFKTNFTLNEIERLKQREDIPLDWNKVELKPAE